MDDLLGGILFLVVAGTLLALAIAAAIAIFATAAVVGSLFVGVHGALRFGSALAHYAANRGGADRTPVAPEPAYELYVLGQLRRDLRRAGEQAWTTMRDDRQKADAIAAPYDDGPTLPLALGIRFGAAVGTVFGVVISGLLASPIVLTALVTMSGAWALIGVLRGIEAVRRRVRRASYECPVDHERFPLPVYVCPSCGAEHRRLVPGRWGIFKRECQCGQVALPTMVLNGRQRVPQRCPSGHAMAGIIGYAQPLRLALVAGPSAGKTTFLAAVLQELEELSRSGTFALSVVEQSRDAYQRVLDDLAHGRRPPKTAVGASPALVAEVQGDGRSRVLSLYDVAGESYASDESRRDLRFLEVPSGLLLLVDPLTLERFSVENEEQIRAQVEGLRPSSMRPIRVLEGTVGSLAEAGAPIDRLPVAVVVTKGDALGVGDEISELVAQHGDRAVPEWLEHQGAGNFVRAVESSFGAVAWFHSSALGRTPDPANTSAFVPRGTAEPVLWLLRRNGVAPSTRPFSPAQSAERLTGASAADFPPISRRGWAWRVAPTGMAALAVSGALIFGAVTLAGTAFEGTGGGDVQYTGWEASADAEDADAGGSEASAGSGSVESETTEPSDEPDTTTFDRGDFTVDLPSSWKPRARNAQREGFVESTWTPAYTRDVLFKVNHTPGFGRTAAAGAREVRAFVVDHPTYEELGWRSARVAGRSAWRWEFMLNNRHKVDYFMTDDCGTGFAILGQTTPGLWDQYVDTFERAVQSVEPAC